MTDADLLAALRAAVAPPRKPRKPRSPKPPAYKLDVSKKAWPCKVPKATPPDARAWLMAVREQFPAARFRITLVPEVVLT